MGEFLKREFDIVVVRLELHYLTTFAAEVRFTFQYQRDGTLKDDGHWRVPIDFATGDDQSLRSGGEFSRRHLKAWESFNLPDGMLDHIRGWLARESRGEEPLWIHLVKPYGPMRLVLWERVFRHELGVRVLMLPDFVFPKPREDGSVLEVAVCASAPKVSLPEDAAAHVKRVIDSIDTGGSRRVRIHVFSDLDLSALKSSLPSAATDIVLHDVNEREWREVSGSPRTVSADGTLRSPWLQWMAQRLAKTSIDVVHFVCHGHLASDRGSLLLSHSPAGDLQASDGGACAIGRGELKTFLTRVGAWSSVFTSLPGNRSKFGLRVIADDIAQGRPGPMMLHDFSLDPDCTSLAEGYRFVYGSTSSLPPATDALLLYCQPYLVAGAEIAPEERMAYTESTAKAFSRNNPQYNAIADAMGASPALDYVFSQGQVAPLVSATERFAEQTRLKYQQLDRDALLRSATSRRMMAVALDTVRRLQLTVAAQSVPAASAAAAALADLLHSSAVPGEVPAAADAAHGVPHAPRAASADEGAEP